MIRSRNTARLARRRVLLAGAGLALLASGASAAGAAAATLKITVSPAKVRQGHNYKLTVLGSYQQSELRGTAYLWEFIQYTSEPCQRTAQSEHALPHSDWSLDYRGKEAGSPFTRRDQWTAGNITGLRHVCAYLYPQVVSAGSKVRPIATADARFWDV